MFAVMKTGGKQYKVASGDVLRIEKIAAEAGDTVQFNDILMIGDAIGAPVVDGAAVQAEVIDQIKGEKTINYVRRRRKHSSKRTKGHRQQLTLIKITELLEKDGDKTGVTAAVGAAIASAMAHNAGGAAPKKAAAKKAAPKAEAPKAEAPKKAAPKKAAPKAEEAPAAEAGEGVRPANLLDAAREGGPDDLKRISGVGPKLEGVLHENGVFHFDQIAAWNASDIAYMDDKLSFKGRIERDDWIAQAKEFMSE